MENALLWASTTRLSTGLAVSLWIVASIMALTGAAGEIRLKADATVSEQAKVDVYNVESPTPKIALVFFAQTHVLPPESPYFKLVGSRDALIEVQSYSKRNASAPQVLAKLSLGAKTLELPLKGPSTLPPPPSVLPQLASHSFKDSFTAVIPKEWVAPGLSVTIEMRQNNATIDHRNFENLKVGPSTKLSVCMFDIHYFGESNGDYLPGWLPEFQAKLPVSELDLTRVRKIIFSKLVMPPRAGKPATLCGSRREYELKTGIKFDGEQSIATAWNAAIKGAAYQLANKFGQKKYYYINIYGVPCGGVGGGFSGVGNGRDIGILLHESGHAWGLPHWTTTNYPYHGTMFGIAGDSEDTPHAGPTWAFDLPNKAFIPPTVQTGAQKGTPGRYKRDPMLGGGEGDQEKPFLFRHFSDYSIHRIQSCFERNLIIDEHTSKYVVWNDQSATYTPFTGKYSDWFPMERNTDIITILASASGVTTEANFVYPPIGPYRGDLVDVIEVPKDLPRASQRLLNETNCNVCFRITQNGKSRTYLAYAKISETDEPLDAESLKTIAINVPARNGAVTQVELLHAPNVFKIGSTEGARVLYNWIVSEHPEVSLQTTEYFLNGVPVQHPSQSAVPATTASSVGRTNAAVVQAPVSEPKPSAAIKIAESPAVSVPEAVRSSWFAKFVQKIDIAAKDKKPLKGWLNAGAKPGTYVLAGADEKSIRIEYDKNIMDIRWSWLKPADQTALAKSLAKENDLESLLILSVFLFSDGQKAEGQTSLARAALIDPVAAEKVRELCNAAPIREEQK